MCCPGPGMLGRNIFEVIPEFVRRAIIIAIEMF